MNRLDKLRSLRKLLAAGKASVGSWIQIPDSAIAEILGDAGYDWVAVDMEHGTASVHQLPDLFRALELGGTLPLARLASGNENECKKVLDSGAAGVIVPMIESRGQLERIRDACRWPPAGNRSVGFCRANLYGKKFGSYVEEAQSPLLVAMIEHERALDDFDDILKVDGLDAILIGPYDLSASIGHVAEFGHPEFRRVMSQIHEQARRYAVPVGVHVVTPDPAILKKRIEEGYQFVAFGTDAIFLSSSSSCPGLV